MGIKVKFVDKEHLEKEIKTIKEQHIKWITQSGDQYTIIYEEYKPGKLKSFNKKELGL